MPIRVRPILLAAAFLLLGLLAFLPGRNGPFMHDDFANLELARVTELSLEEINYVALRNQSGALRRPISNLSFALDDWFNGQSAPAFKTTNLLIHFLVGLLVFVFVGRLLSASAFADPTQCRWIATVSALIWLLHPLQVSTVLYVVQRMTQLATLFTLLALLPLIHWAAQKQASAMAALTVLIKFAAFAILALMSKETGALLPLYAATCLAFVYWSQCRTWADLTRIEKLVIGTAVLLPISVGAALLLWNQDAWLGGYAGRDFTLVERLSTQAVALWHYIGLIALPRPDAMGLLRDDFPVYSPADPIVWVSLAGLVGLASLAWFTRRKFPVLAFTVAWFLTGHAMESTVLPLELVYEHRNYLAILGPAVLASVAMQKIRGTPTRWLVLACVVIVLALMTLKRSYDWGTLERFASTELSNHPESSRAIALYAGVALQKGDFSQADHLFAQLQQKNPGRAWPLLAQAISVCADKDAKPAWAIARELTKSEPPNDITYRMVRALVGEYVSNNCPPLSGAALRAQLHTMVDYMPLPVDKYRVEALYLLSASTYEAEKDYKSARQEYTRAISANPMGYIALMNLAYLELNTGRYEQAEWAIRKATENASKTTPTVLPRIRELDRYLTSAKATNN